MRRSRGSLLRFPARRRPEALPWATRLLIILGAVVLFAVWGWLRNADSRALASMNPDLRRELFERTRADAEALCARPGLVDECRTRIEFLARFPECDGSCRELVARHQRRLAR